MNQGKLSLTQTREAQVEKPFEKVLPRGGPKRASGYSQPTQMGKRSLRICGIGAFPNISALQSSNLPLREQSHLVRTPIERWHIVFPS